MNADSIEKFYRLYSKDVYIYTFSLCKNEQLAEDIMQEAFLKGILSLGDDHENVKAWLFMVCRNLWIDYIRKNKKLSKIDEDFKKTAEKLINEEFATVLNIPVEEVSSFILNHLPK